MLARRSTCVALIVALAAFATVFLWSSREIRTLSDDGRIVLDADFFRTRSFPPRIFTLVEWIGGLLPETWTSLKKQDLLKAAEYWCGEGDFWEHPYGEEALTALTDAIETDRPPLSMMGRLFLRENFVTWLCAQKRVSRYVRQYPDVLNEQIDAVVIAGAPRTGSTHLLSMLCRHPNATCLTFAESLNPLSPVSRGQDILTWKDFRLWKTYAASALILSLRPLFRHMFKFGPREPMEELQLGAVVFGSCIFNTEVYLPSYEQWFLKADHTPMEQYIKLLLQVIQYQRKLGEISPSPRKMWILKSPQNADQLGPKTKVYPNAKFIFTHREMVPVMESLIGMLLYTVGIFNHPDKVDYQGLSRLWLDHQRWSQVDRLSREEVHKHIQPLHKLMNIRFKEFMTDPVAMALKAAKHAGLDGGFEAREAFERFQRESPQEGSKILRYDIQSVGITKDEIRTAFAPYELEYL